MTKEFAGSSYLYAANAVYIEELYEKYSMDPSSVSEEWRDFFASNSANYPHPSWKKLQFSIIEDKKEDPKAKKLDQKIDSSVLDSILKLRHYGHLASILDPLGLEVPQKLEALGIDPSHPLKNVYAGTCGVEFSHVQIEEEREWLYAKFEEEASYSPTKEQKIDMLNDLIKVEGLEQYIHKKFPGAKRFSVEGGESSIIAMEHAVDEASKFGVSEVVVGMAHRGRLNTLTKVLGKPYEAVLGEFMGKYTFPEELGIASDVKYHMGYSSDVTTKSGNKVHLTLTPNPSHLEAVNPVVAGRVRAKQDLMKDHDRTKVMGLLVHGDAAFCGQGVVAESLMLSTLEAFETGGIFHIVINNQVGFTANSKDGHRFSRYSTEFAKIIGAPIIHVNGDDVEAVSRATKVLSEYRAKFKKDAVLEVICYRKYGHNEGDEPMYTQPIMYNIIKARKSPAELYSKKLEQEGAISSSEYESFVTKFKNFLDEAYEKAKTYSPVAHFLEGIWEGYSREFTDADNKLPTGIEKQRLEKLLKNLATPPHNYTINSKLTKLFEQRISDFSENKIDWATAEQLAFATLLEDGYPIRLIGQDAGRGTFSHRHSVLHDQNTGAKYLPLNNLDSANAKYEVADSCLSEYAVMGYELGYSMSSPKSLVIWEAQFGDFSNSAQIIFDQFLSATETKWLRLTGLVLLLPHSYEGQGPEHTSARLERILQLCAEDNMQVCYPTTPSSIFHLLRRQQIRKVRKPLIIMSPKSVFRNSLAVSRVEEISHGTKFSPVIADDLDPKAIKRVVVCSGKVYYDLLDARSKNNIKDIALVRVEQLYPFPFAEFEMEMKKYSSAELVWCQEEPENMGPWSYFYSRIVKNLNRKDFKLVSRHEAASPATGYASVHAKEQEKLVKTALKILGE